MVMYSRIVYSACTLYMVLVLIRWASPVLQLEMDTGRLAWIKKVTDPAIDSMRKIFPAIGPIDLSPVAVLFALWFVRTLLLRVLSLSA